MGYSMFFLCLFLLYPPSRRLSNTNSNYMTSSTIKADLCAGCMYHANHVICIFCAILTSLLCTVLVVTPCNIVFALAKTNPALFFQVSSEVFRLGRTRVFFRAGQISTLQKILNETTCDKGPWILERLQQALVNRHQAKAAAEEAQVLEVEPSLTQLMYTIP